MEAITITISTIALIISIVVARINYKNHNLLFEIGKAAFHSYIISYFLINYHRTDFIETRFNVTQDENRKKHYISELVKLADRLDDLKTQSFYSVLYKKFPQIAFLPNFIRQEIRYLNERNDYGYNHDVWSNMFTALTKINKEIKSSRSEIEVEIFNYAKSVNQLLNTP